MSLSLFVFSDGYSFPIREFGRSLCSLSPYEKGYLLTSLSPLGCQRSVDGVCLYLCERMSVFLCPLLCHFFLLLLLPLEEKVWIIAALSVWFFHSPGEQIPSSVFPLLSQGISFPLFFLRRCSFFISLHFTVLQYMYSVFFFVCKKRPTRKNVKEKEERETEV